MIETMVNSIIHNKMRIDYAHLEHPAILVAKIIKVKALGSTYEWEGTIIDKETLLETEVILKGKYFQYNLKALKKDGNIDENIPTIIDVESVLQFKIGQKVAVALLYGELNAQIIGEVT